MNIKLLYLINKFYCFT